MSGLLELLFEDELYRRWQDCYVSRHGAPTEAGELPDRAALSSVVATELESFRPEQAADAVREMAGHFAHMELDSAVRQLACLRHAVVDTAPDSALTGRDRGLATFHHFLDLVLAEVTASVVVRLKDQAARDPLTGLANRRRLEEDLGRELARAERSGKPLTVMMIDLDRLKATNDRFGHEAGDRRLTGLADRLRAGLRQGDAAYRVGGDEFVVLLPDTTADEIEPGHSSGFSSVVERLGWPAACEFSWGAATYPLDAKDAAQLLRAADERLLTRREQVRPG